MVSLLFEYSIPDRVCEYHQSQLKIRDVAVTYSRPASLPAGYEKARLLGFRHAATPFYTKAKLEVWAPRKIKVPTCSSCSAMHEAFLRRG